jgi:hypothetical protein
MAGGPGGRIRRAGTRQEMRPLILHAQQKRLRSTLPSKGMTHPSLGGKETKPH